ncbi:hypothetical protein FB451DRAFT_1176114 [Mycena latifolia]|nr:hypothetical protein FB451DRAFT_1176114 [Mycena latifolia]
MPVHPSWILSTMIKEKEPKHTKVRQLLRLVHARVATEFLVIQDVEFFRPKSRSRILREAKDWEYNASGEESPRLGHRKRRRSLRDTIGGQTVARRVRYLTRGESAASTAILALCTTPRRGGEEEIERRMREGTTHFTALGTGRAQTVALEVAAIVHVGDGVRWSEMLGLGVDQPSAIRPTPLVINAHLALKETQVLNAATLVLQR